MGQMRIGIGMGVTRGNKATGEPLPGPINTVRPEITHPEPFELGDVLTCDDGTWATLGTISAYTKQWRRLGVVIPGETGDTFEPEAADDDVSIFTCVVTATDEFGSRSRTSNAVGPYDLVPEPIISDAILDGSNNAITDGSNNSIFS